MGISIDVTTTVCKCVDHFAKKREAKRNVCKAALKCLKNERPNFEHIVEQRPYSKDPLHKKAVTAYSFEKLSDAMMELRSVGRFRSSALNLFRLAEQRDAVGILAMIDQLETKLQNYIRE